MSRKRVIHGAMVLVLTLSLFAAPMVWAADAPVRAQGVTAFWAGIDGWFQGLLASLIGPEPIEATFEAQNQCPTANPTCPGDQDGGSGGPSTTDGGADSDPNG